MREDLMISEKQLDMSWVFWSYDLEKISLCSEKELNIDLLWSEPSISDCYRSTESLLESIVSNSHFVLVALNW